MKSLFSILVFAAGLQLLAQPGPGDLFREYVWLPEMVAGQGKFLRVGGKINGYTPVTAMWLALYT